MNAVVVPQDIDIQRFSTWLDSNDSFQTPYSEKTKRVYRSVVSGLLAFLAREDIRSFGEFNTAWLRRFISRDPETGALYSQSYQILRTSALKIFWFWMVETKAAVDNPVEQLLEEKRRDSKQPAGGKRPKRLPDVLNWEEQRELLAAVQRSESRTSVRDYALATTRWRLRADFIGPGQRSALRRDLYSPLCQRRPGIQASSDYRQGEQGAYC